MSCKAYDALYALKEVEIFYPMTSGRVENVANYDAEGNPIPDSNGKLDPSLVVDGLYQGKISLSWVIGKLFELINQTMRDKGVKKSPYTYWMDERLFDINIPLPAIETKSAWDILQDIANAGCCFIYCDRDTKWLL